jgi:hypothetical protein
MEEIAQNRYIEHRQQGDQGSDYNKPQGAIADPENLE